MLPNCFTVTIKQMGYLHMKGDLKKTFVRDGTRSLSGKENIFFSLITISAARALHFLFRGDD